MPMNRHEKMSEHRGNDKRGELTPKTGGAAVRVPVRLLREGARLPERAYAHDAAYDLCAAEAVTVPPLARAVVATGIALGLPPGLAALTLPRSGLAARHGIALVNTPGLIDPGYRGEISLILHNTDRADDFVVAVGDRVAQLLFIALPSTKLVPSDVLDDTGRGSRGFGSSGSAAAPPSDADTDPGAGA
jgi:dUTP pyrophosphatase